MPTTGLKNIFNRVRVWSETNYLLYCFSLVILGVLARFFFAQFIPISALGSDDFGNLRKSIYYPQGDFFMGGLKLDDQGQYGGLLYPFSIVPWQWFSSVYAKMQALFLLNSLFAGATAFLSCLILARITTARSFLAPLIIVSCGPVFLVTYAALAENLLYTFIAFAGYTLIEFSNNPRSRKWLFLVLLSALLAPMVRQPGYAVSLGLAVALLACEFAPLRKRICLSGLVLIVGTVPSMLVAKQIGAIIGKQRESVYMNQVSLYFDSLSDIPTLFSLGYNQLLYLIFAGALFPMLAVLFVFRGEIKQIFSGKSIYHWYALIVGGLFIAFCLLHLIIKFDLDPNVRSFIYGRYDDPALIVLLPLGLAYLLNVKALPWLSRFCFAILLMLIAYFVVARAFLDADGGTTLNISGYFFPLSYPQLFWVPIVSMGVVFIVFMLPQKIAVASCLALALVINLLTIGSGVPALAKKARSYYRLAAGADWIIDNIDSRQCIAYNSRWADYIPRNKRKQAGKIIRMMEVFTYPRPALRSADKSQWEICSLLFAPLSAEQMPSPWQKVWQNGDYLLWQKP
ncbi:MAG: hypothetical protein IT292_11800 [Deltaproteobacteria bacterium]|nr:hypothetical protein [Deltaproteobacteria bacterium]